MALDLETLSPREQITAIYIGYYDRAGDPFGMNFWETALANPSLDLDDIADDFSTQAETLIAYPFLGDPTPEEAAAFITEVYLNLFNREPDDAGLTFWSDALLAAIANDDLPPEDQDPDVLSVGEIILAIIEGAQDVEGGPQDRTTILNKIEVGVAWTDAAEASGLTEADDYPNDPLAQASAKSIIEPVTDDESTVVAAKSDIDDFFDDEPSVPGKDIFLTSATDVNGMPNQITGEAFEATENDDAFWGYIAQNPFAGGVSNTLSSADRLDGLGGNDRLYAELTDEFVGTNSSGSGDDIDIQPRLANIEEIDIEARDGQSDDNNIFVDGKHITDHEEIGSYYSDGDLRIENLTTLTSSGFARNTEAITITMDHTDNFNSDEDASDLRVYFDNDYLLSGQDAESEIVYWLLDEEAERTGNPNRLQNIDVDGIIFNVIGADGSSTQVIIEADAANTAGTHEQFVIELQAPFQAAIDAGLVPEGSRLYLDPTNTDFTFDDDGNQSEPIPGIVVESGDGTELVATGFSRIEEEIGEYDVYGRFDSSGQDIIDQPIEVNIDLYKAGRGGEGGDIVVGGKSENTPDGIADGIEVFHINVRGAGNDDPNGLLTKPSDVGTITSTGDELEEVYIKTDPTFALGDTYASLTVRNGFDENRWGDQEDGDLKLINADEFLGDLTLGDLAARNNSGRITNADMITAQGGGDVTLGLLYDGEEEAQAYTVYTAGGDDNLDIEIDGDATDHYGSSLMVSTGEGDDMVRVDTSDFTGRDDYDDYGGGKGGRGGRGGEDDDDDNEQLNQAILDNIDINTGAGDDHIEADSGSRGNLNIYAGTGDDFIDTSGGSPREKASWAYNFDDAREGYTNGKLEVLAAKRLDGDLDEDDLPGVPTSLAYVGGATVTVTLSGAGILGDLVAGGGIMAEEAQNAIFDLEDGAVARYNGYEGRAKVENLKSGNTYWGDQRDVIDAIKRAIEDDPVLSKLLKVDMTENNTIVITSTTGGRFDPKDLKIEISQDNKGSSAASWDAVEAEARQVFSDSSIVITDLGDANGDDLGPDVPDLRTTYGDPLNVDHKDSTHDWFSGLSASRDDDGYNASEYTQIFSSNPSRRETDNVITPGEGDDLTVLSTEAGNYVYREPIDSIDSVSSSGIGLPVIPIGPMVGPRQKIAEDGEAGPVGGVSSFTRIDGNTLVNGASNETLVFKGMFGDDTIMNFTTADPVPYEVSEIENKVDFVSSTVGVGEDEGEDATTNPQIFEVEFSDVEDEDTTGTLSYGDSSSITVASDDTAEDLVDKVVAEGNMFIGGREYVPSDDGTKVIFTEVEPAVGSAQTVDISDFNELDGVVAGLVVTTPGSTNDDGSPFVPGSPSTFTLCFGDASTSTTYSFLGEEIPVLAGQTGESIAIAVLNGIYDGWTVSAGAFGDEVVFTATEDGPTPIPSLGEFGGTINIPGTPSEEMTYNAGLDFLDYSDYLTSEYDRSSENPENSNDSEVLIPVTLDYNEASNLGGEGDGASNILVEANEVAVARMENDSVEGETFANLNASVIEGIFNNNVDDDNEWGGLSESEFNVETYTKTGVNPELIGDAKAVIKIENPNNLGEYKVFELTWSGDNTSDSGSTVSAKLIGTQDYGTSLTGLDDINLVGSDDYGMLIEYGLVDILGVPMIHGGEEIA